MTPNLRHTPCRIGALAALAGLAIGATAAHAQPLGRLYVGTDQGVFSGPGSTTRIKVFICPSEGTWSPAAGEFDIVASSGGWQAASGGNFLLGDGSVRFISYSIPPAPAGALPAPVEVWNGELRSNSAVPRLVRVEADPEFMTAYPSPSAPPVPVVPVGSVGFILDNPLGFGPALVAPGDGTAIQVGPSVLTATPTGPGPGTVGLLLPAVQKVREAAARSAPTFTLTFQGQVTGAAIPVEELQLNFNKFTASPGVGVQAAASGNYTSCFVGASGVWICLIEDEPTIDGLTIGRLPDTHMFEMDRDPETGNVRTTATLEWDEPVEVSYGSVREQTVRLRIASVNNNPALPSFGTQGRGVMVLSTSHIGPHIGPMVIGLENRCRPDLTTTAIPNHPGYGEPDGRLNNDDFFYFLTQFAAGNVAVADLTGSAISGTPGYAMPNGVLNNDDFFYYLAAFARGC